jgi:hypothetical protein
MQTIQLEIFKFHELSEAAKATARDNWRERDQYLDFAWSDEAIQSIQTFCEHFGARLTNWSVGAHSPYSYDVDAPHSLFRGLKVAEVNRDYMPTGYCLDCTLWYTFHDEFKRTGCASKAFEAALDAAFKDWRSDMESQLEDDYIDEHLEINEYDFTASGKRWY